MRAESNPRRRARHILDLCVFSAEAAESAAARGIMRTCRRRRRDPFHTAASASALVAVDVAVESRFRSRVPLHAGNLELLYPVNPCIYFSFREGDSFRVVGFTIAYLQTKDRTM